MASPKPNILILWGDDIGWSNISYNSRGQMGYRTPNIDRVANEGVAFTDDEHRPDPGRGQPGDELRRRPSGRRMLVGVDPAVRDQLVRTGLLGVVGAENIFMTQPQRSGCSNDLTIRKESLPCRSYRSSH
jgi:hypothetical protein